jgi:hypothetical protein
VSKAAGDPTTGCPARRGAPIGVRQEEDGRFPHMAPGRASFLKKRDFRWTGGHRLVGSVVAPRRRTLPYSAAVVLDDERLRDP